VGIVMGRFGRAQRADTALLIEVRSRCSVGAFGTRLAIADRS
jgi:hypothetical protein